MANTFFFFFEILDLELHITYSLPNVINKMALTIKSGRDFSMKGYYLQSSPTYVLVPSFLFYCVLV